jgi:hypothetical protein
MELENLGKMHIPTTSWWPFDSLQEVVSMGGSTIVHVSSAKMHPNFWSKLGVTSWHTTDAIWDSSHMYESNSWLKGGEAHDVGSE